MKSHLHALNVSHRFLRIANPQFRYLEQAKEMLLMRLACTVSCQLTVELTNAFGTLTALEQYGVRRKSRNKKRFCPK